VIILIAAAALAVHSQMGPATSDASSCSPQPCADAGGYRMDVANVQRGEGIVRMEVTFHVSGRNNMHAEPVDFSLVQDGHSYHPYFGGSGCSSWPRTQIPDGSSLGPKVVCFRPAGTDGTLTLNWNPDLGISEYFSSGYNLTLS